MSLKRSRLEIYLDVLKVINEGVEKPTRIMYSTNLSWNTLKEALRSLHDQGMVNVENVRSAKRYSILPKGVRALKYFWKVQEEFSFSQESSH